MKLFLCECLRTDLELLLSLLQLIQFLCMALHRMSTFLQICSITEIKLKAPKQVQPEEQISIEKGLQLVRDMQVTYKITTLSSIFSNLKLALYYGNIT